MTLCIAPYPVKKLNGNITKIKKEEETQNRRVGKRRTIGKEQVKSNTIAILINNISNTVINTNMIITKLVMENLFSNLGSLDIGIKDDD